MTEQEITALGPAFAAYLRRFRDSFGQDRTAAHFDTYCRGLLSDLPRKSVEPIALDSRDRGPHPPGVPGHRPVGPRPRPRHPPAAPRRRCSRTSRPTRSGTVGVIDETSCRKWGDHTPGVQRQYLGCVGKIDNGIVTVHVGVARGHVPGPAGRRPVPAQVVGRGPRPVPGGGHPRRRPVPAEVAAGGGPVAPAERATGCRSTGWCSTRGTGRRSRS